MLLSRKLLTFTTAMIDPLLEWPITLNNSVFMMMIKNDFKITFESQRAPTYTSVIATTEVKCE